VKSYSIQQIVAIPLSKLNTALAFCLYSVAGFARNVAGVLRRLPGRLAGLMTGAASGQH
jgi:hypothetical protein